MRKSALLSATSIGMAIGAIAFLSAPYAKADTTVSTASTTRLNTSTAGNIVVGSGGSITLQSGTAITVDSSHTVSVEGPINMDASSSGSTAILIDGGQTSTITIKSTITAAETFTAADSNSDGILDGPFASGSDRYGVHSRGSSPFIGNFVTTNASSFVIEGNSSYGIRFENKINGLFTYDSSMSLTGDNSVGISLENGATGTVYLSGSIAYKGTNSSAVVLKGDFGDKLIIDGSYSGTGYATIASLTTTALANLTAADFYQGGVLVDIQGNVANGILLSSTVTSTSDSNTDEDGNGILDTDQTVGSLTVYGSSPALRIASANNDIHIGGLTYVVTPVSPPSVNYGLNIRGNVLAYGIYENKDAKAIELGGQGHNVVIDNGILITGTVTSTGYKSSATALNVLSGLSTPRLDIGGTLYATTTTTKGDTSTALNIATGASLPQINVAHSSFISAVTNGSQGKAVAILDRSNSVTSITNNGAITAIINASDDNSDSVADTVVNRAIAIDLSANSVGATIAQIDDSTATTISNPSITGDILLGSGNDTVSSSGGTITGNIDFGAGVNSFSLSNSAVYKGKLTSSGTVDFDLSSGTATLSKGTNINVSELHVGSTGALTLTLDSSTPLNPIISGSGPVTFDNGAELNLSLDEIVLSATHYNVISASSIDLGNMNIANLDGKAPFIYHVDLTKSADSTLLMADLRLKTQSEGGLNDNEYAAFTPILTAASSNSSTTTSLLTPTTEDAFKAVLNQFLPNYSAENILGLSHSNQSMAEALGTLTHIPKSGTSQYWLQEHGFNQTRDSGETSGFDTTGFSFAGGRETAMGDNSAIGVYIAYTSISPYDGYAIANETLTSSDLTIGGYWRTKTDRMRAWAHAGVGYNTFDSNRQLITTSANHQAQAKWHGTSASAGVGISYDYPIGSFVLTPVASANYYSLKEDAYNEIGGTDSFNLYVASRTGQIAAGRGILRLRYDKWAIKPEVYLGFKSNLVGDAGKTKVHFKNGADFILNSGDLTGSGVLGGVRLFMDSEWSYFSLQAGFEQTDEVTDSNLELRTRFSF